MSHNLKHTTGPWYADKIEDRAAFNIFTPGQCSALLTLEPGKHNGADPRVLNVEADARLIAAAPELLEALEKCEERLTFLAQNSVDVVRELKMARAAIGKATGHQQ